MLGAFAMAITYSGLPQQLAGGIIRKLNNSQDAAKGESSVKWTLLLIILAMGIMSQKRRAYPYRVYSDDYSAAFAGV